MSAGGRSLGARAVLLATAVALAAGGFGWLAASVASSGRAAVAAVRDAEPPDLARHAAAIEAAAARAGCDPDLLRALVAVESRGDERARSPAGALGLCQLMPATAAEQARRDGLDPAAIDLLDAATSLRLGAGYLVRLLGRFDGAEPFALAAYNAGPENVLRWRLRAVDSDPAEVVRREAFPETRAHVARTLRWREAYRRRQAGARGP